MTATARYQQPTKCSLANGPRAAWSGGAGAPSPPTVPPPAFSRRTRAEETSFGRVYIRPSRGVTVRPSSAGAASNHQHGKRPAARGGRAAPTRPRPQSATAVRPKHDGRGSASRQRRPPSANDRSIEKLITRIFKERQSWARDDPICVAVGAGSGRQRVQRVQRLKPESARSRPKHHHHHHHAGAPLADGLYGKLFWKRGHRAKVGVDCSGDERREPSSCSSEAVHPQDTISTATNSLSPAGSTINEAPLPLKPLTKASVDICSLEERKYLQQLMLSLHGSERGSLDFYRFGRVMGEGSFAKVRIAWHKLTGQQVAVKTYERRKVHSTSQWNRVQHEVKLMERLNHPRIARLFESVESSKRIHIVMEYASGGNLCSFVKRKKRLDEREAHRLLLQVLEAVKYMHELGVVHRDIKLENVLLDENQDVKLVDFGFSAYSKGRRLRVFCGTPSYMAPEIIRREEYDGPPADIWSLGVLLYACCVGCFPFSGANYPELYKKIGSGRYRLPEWLSTSVQDLIGHMLVVDVRKRFTLAQVMAHPFFKVAPRASKAANRSSSSSSSSSKQGIHISANPQHDICSESLSRLQGFGADKATLLSQVMQKRHSSLTTTYYLLRKSIHQSGGNKLGSKAQQAPSA